MSLAMLNDHHQPFSMVSEPYKNDKYLVIVYIQYNVGSWNHRARELSRGLIYPTDRLYLQGDEAHL